MKSILRYTLLACALSAKLAMQGAVRQVAPSTFNTYVMSDTDSSLPPINSLVRVRNEQNGRHMSSYTGTVTGYTKSGRVSITSDGKPKSAMPEAITIIR